MIFGRCGGGSWHVLKNGQALCRRVSVPILDTVDQWPREIDVCWPCRRKLEPHEFNDPAIGIRSLEKELAGVQKTIGELEASLRIANHRERDLLAQRELLRQKTDALRLESVELRDQPLDSEDHGRELGA
jgi:hypothetical protein